ncbi:hypothetical protein [Varibaculum vaginae]|uniref:hypothetical protein n=1 Tax=Varibaculum vaginae TaxID=2364797 RepID=UPI000F08FE39|nr:hypothetical protein [Varibaculum vaginae]
MQNNLQDSPEDLELTARKSDIDQLIASWPSDGKSVYPQVTLSDIEVVASKLSATLDSLDAQVERK